MENILFILSKMKNILFISKFSSTPPPPQLSNGPPLRTFADDTMLSVKAETEETAAQHYSLISKYWTSGVGSGKLTPILLFKTICLTINRIGGEHSFLHMNGLFVREGLDHKHLGVRLSHDRKWTAHLNYTIGCKHSQVGSAG